MRCVESLFELPVGTMPHCVDDMRVDDERDRAESVGCDSSRET
jgi:hypothetical protein